MHAGVVGQLAALLVPGAGHSEDAEVVQDAAAALQQCSSHDWDAGLDNGHAAGWDDVEHCRGHQRTLHY